MAADVESVGIAPETLGILVGPGNSTPHLLCHDANVTVRRADRSKIKRDVINPGVDEKLGCVAMSFACSARQAPPCIKTNMGELVFFAGYKSRASTDVGP